MPKINPTPQQIHNLEQEWVLIDGMLEQTLGALRYDMPEIKDFTGLSDASILFDYIRNVFLKRFMTDPNALAQIAVLCAAALTKLARQAPRADDDPLARLEKEVNNDDNS